MSEHTKGPWTVEPDRGNADRGWVEIRSGRTNVVDAAEFRRHRGGETEFHSGVRISPANARLIAAAPCLLEAAMLVVAAHDGSDPDVGMEDAMDRLQAVIARATGKDANA